MSKKYDSKNVLVIADTHIPFQHTDYLEFCKSIQKQEKCGTVVHIGDLVDNHAISYHEHDPDLWSPLQEMEEADKTLKKWFKAFPEVKVVRGNHDCYDEETEILTNIGWKKGVDLEGHEIIATLNIDTNEIEYQHPSEFILKNYEGEMIRVNSKRNIDLLVTPSHRMLVSSKETKIDDPTYSFKKAYQLNSSYRYFAVSGNNRNKECTELNDDWLRLLGWIITDGSKNGDNYKIYQSKECNFDKIRNILNNLEITYKEIVRQRDTTNICGKELLKQPLPAHEFIFSSKKLSEYLSDKYELPHIFGWISKRQFDIFLDSVLDGDGTKFWETRSPDRSSCVIYGTEKILSQLQSLCIRNGCMATLVEYRDNDWKLNVIIDKIKVGHTDGISAEWYKGKVWCVTVPNSTVVVRRNGAVSIQGNCLVDRKGKTVGLPRRCFRPYREIWNLPDKWEDDFNYEIDKVIYQHGTGMSGKLAHLNIAIANRASTVIGHIHSFAGIAYTASPRDCIFGMNVGSGVDNKALAFAYGRDFPHKPIVSCGVVYNGEDPQIFRMRL